MKIQITDSDPTATLAAEHASKYIRCITYRGQGPYLRTEERQPEPERERERERDRDRSKAEAEASV